MTLWADTRASSGTLDECIDRIARKEPLGMDDLYQLAAPGVYAFALSILKNSHDAEDVLQDTFLRIYDGAASYHSQGKPMAWILTITKNLCYKRLQELKRGGAIPLEEWKDYGLAQSGTTSDDRLVIQACMEKLTDDERQIVVLHAVSGFKHREIAKMLDMKLSTVLSKYHRAVKKLKNNL